MPGIRLARCSALIDHRGGDARGLPPGYRKTERLADRVDRRLARFSESGHMRIDAGPDRDRIVTGQETVRHVEAQRAVDLELLLREELVTRGLVREAVVSPRVVPDIVVLVAIERR